MPDAVILDALRTPIGRYGGRARARAPRRPRRPRDRARPSSATSSTRRRWTRSTWAAPTRRARTTATWRAWRRCSPGLPAGGAGRDRQPPLRVGPRGGRSRPRRQIRLGEADLVLAGGVESMTRAPLVMLKPERGFPRGERRAGRHHDRLALRQPAPRRAPLDRVDGRDGRERGRALRRLARGPGRVRARVAPARGRRRRGRAASTTRSSRSTCPSRRATRSRSTPTRARAPTPRSSGSPSCRPIFREGGTVTAGNSSQINDGAACVVRRERGARPRAGPRAARADREQRVGRRGPGLMGIGPVPGDAQGARARRPRAEGHRPGGAERGVRLAGARLDARARASTTTA